jgi:hypothetical protein
MPRTMPRTRPGRAHGRSAEEKAAREATTPEPLDWVRPCGPALFAVPAEPAADTIRYRNTARDATVSEYCRAYSSLLRCAERIGSCGGK